MKYGGSTNNMRNAQGGYYSATRNNYSPIDGKEWILSGTNTTFNQASGYKATEFCSNLNNGDQTVTLKVNWGKCWTEYRKKTRTWNNCLTTSSVCQGGYDKYCYGGFNINTCREVEGQFWESGKCCQRVYNSCKTTKSVCNGGWNSYGKWGAWGISNTCSSSTNGKSCKQESKKVCP